MSMKFFFSASRSTSHFSNPQSVVADSIPSLSLKVSSHRAWHELCHPLARINAQIFLSLPRFHCAFLDAVGNHYRAAQSIENTGF